MMDMREDYRDLLTETETSTFSNQISDGIFATAADWSYGRESYGFLELLGLQDFHHLPLDLPPHESQANFPATPNSSSISSASTEAGYDEEIDKSKKQTKAKGEKRGQKRPRAARIAFMTKSEVDHLEDGYRWRKYGQKAVKNSPFPRSYYRCTTATCGVKKRVERSSMDRTVVVTTYEGQHTHLSPVAPRGGRVSAAEAAPWSYLTAPQVAEFRREGPYVDVSSRFCGWTKRSDPLVRDHGLLQDVIPVDAVKEEWSFRG